MVRVFVRKPNVRDACEILIAKRGRRYQFPAVIERCAIQPWVTDQMDRTRVHNKRGMVYPFNLHEFLRKSITTSPPDKCSSHIGSPEIRAAASSCRSLLRFVP